MSELLLFAHDHAEATPDHPPHMLAALYRPYDLVVWCPDGWPWGSEELKSPKFRIVAWPEADERELDALLSPQLPARDADLNATTHWQRRSHFLDMAHPSISVEMRAWWDDATRAEPIWRKRVPEKIATVKAARQPWPL